MGEQGAIILMVVGCGILAASDAMSKLLAARYPPGEIVCLRALIALPFLIPAAVYAGAFTALFRKDALFGQVLRAVFDSASMFLLVYGLGQVPFNQATVLMLTGPLFVTIIARIALGELLTFNRGLALFAGFLGAVIVLRPGTAAFDPAAAWIIAAALTGALRDIVTRFIGLRQSAVATQMFTTMVAAAGSAATFLFGWIWPSLTDWGMIAIASLLFTLAHCLFIQAFRRAEAILLAPFKYTLIVWAFLLGALLWNETPDLGMIAGAAIIALAGLHLFRAGTSNRG